MFDFLKSKPSPAVDRVEPTLNRAEFVDVQSSDSIRMGQIFGQAPTASGAVVNEITANRVSAVYACARLIGGAISTIPCDFNKRTPEGREQANDHPFWWFFNEQPTPIFTAASFWEFITNQMLMRGDGFAYLVRPNQFSPGLAGVVPLHRDKVFVFRQGNRLRYTIMDTLADGTEGSFTVDQDDMLHFPGFAFNGLCSMSVIGYAARQAAGIAIKADEHAATMFGSGASIQYAVKVPKQMSPELQENFRQAWVAKYCGSGVSGIPLILTEGLDVQELSMTAVDAQLLESRRYNAVDIARAFGVPPHMIGETTASTSWGSGIEQMSIGFVKYTLQPHLTRFAQELNRKLFPRLERYFVEFNVDGLLATDSKTQAEYFGKALGGPGAKGWMTQDEVRRRKNLPPLGGDAATLSGGMPSATPKDEPDEDAEDRPAAA